MSQSLAQTIKAIAKEIGFNDVKFISAKPLLESEKNFLAWRSKGYAAEMNYLLKENPIHARPEFLLEDAKTIIMFSANYYSECPTRPSLEHGRIASYAVGLDYHKVLRKKIKELIAHPELKDVFAKSKFFTDAVPLLEKSFAKKAGLGFRGRNSLLISRENGSFNFIAEIITDIEIEADKTIDTNAITCGNCTRCMDICPTEALPEEYQLDARKCISYHTIENRGKIPKDLSDKFGEWFFGCDLCQNICPYNKKSIPSTFDEFRPESGFGHWFYLPEILDLEFGRFNKISKLQEQLEKHKYIHQESLTLIKKLCEKNSEISEDLLEQIFQIKFARTPLLRPKRKALIRNAKIVLNYKIPTSP
jgi:epoxyqueuosine reductase